MFRFSESDRSLPLLATGKARAETYRHRGHPWIMFFSKRQKVASQELSVEPGRVQKALLLGGQSKRNQGLIFATSTGGPISPRNFIRHFEQALINAGLPDIRVHDLRYSHASLLLASGVNPKLVQERLGHASITLTLDTYSHVIPSLQEEVARKMDDLMN